MRQIFSLLIVAALLCAPILSATAYAEQHPGAYTVAKRGGPILWHIGDKEMRTRMENDLELLRLHNEAFEAKQKRKKLGLALFTPGAILIGAGFVAGLFQNAIGLYDSETGEYLMVGGFAVGVVLVTPGIYFTAKESKEEKAYKSYVEETYGVKPIIRFNPVGNQIMLGLAGSF